jgi:hypothetical protein
MARSEIRDVLGNRGRLLLAVLGMRGDQAAIKLVREERLAIPLAILRDDERLVVVHDATRAAEQISSALRSAIRWAVAQALAPAGRSPDKDEVSRITSSLGGERTYWGTVAPRFEELLDSLERHDTHALLEFARQARGAALDAFRRATEGLGTPGRQLQGTARAEQSLRRDLRTVLTEIGVEA